MTEIPEGQICEGCKEKPAIHSLDFLDIQEFIFVTHYFCQKCFDKLMDFMEESQ